MNRAGTVKFERDAQGNITIVLLVQGVPIARSASANSIAAEIAFRDLGTLVFNELLEVRIPTTAAMLPLAAYVSPEASEVASAAELIGACAW